MRHTILSTFLFAVILGLGCMGVAVPGKADELKHPIELGKECRILFDKYLWATENRASFNYYNAFAYAYDTSGRYACGYAQSPRSAVERCNEMASGERGGQKSSPPGTRGDDLGGCQVYAKSPVDGKLAIVWKEEPKQVATKHKKLSGTKRNQKPWAGYKSDITDGDYDLTIRFSEMGDKYFAELNWTGSAEGALAECSGAVDEQGNLEKVDCTPAGVRHDWPKRELAGNVSRIELLATGGHYKSSAMEGSSALFVEKQLAQRLAETKSPKLTKQNKPAVATSFEKITRAEISKLIYNNEKNDTKYFQIKSIAPQNIEFSDGTRLINNFIHDGGQPYSPKHNNLSTSLIDKKTVKYDFINAPEGAKLSYKIQEDWNDNYGMVWKIDAQIIKRGKLKYNGLTIDALVIKIKGTTIEQNGFKYSSWHQNNINFTEHVILEDTSKLLIGFERKWHSITNYSPPKLQRLILNEIIFTDGAKLKWDDLVATQTNLIQKALLKAKSKRQ